MARVGQREAQTLREPSGLEEALLKARAALEDPRVLEVGVGVDAGQRSSEGVVLLDDVG